MRQRTTFHRCKGQPASQPNPRRHQLKIHLSHRLSADELPQLKKLLRRLPRLVGDPISVSVLPQLTAYRGKLLSRSPERGTPVYAASFLRQRKIVLEEVLLSQPRVLPLILTHEIFHFVWPRLGNDTRRQFAAVLHREWQSRAQGELGESSGVRKSTLKALDSPAEQYRLWRDYVCESFCDTAAWLYSGVSKHQFFSLANRWRQRRKRWFDSTFAGWRNC